MQHCGVQFIDIQFRKRGHFGGCSFVYILPLKDQRLESEEFWWRQPHLHRIDQNLAECPQKGNKVEGPSTFKLSV